MTDRRMSADHKAFQERLSDYSQEWEFIAWLEREGHDRNKVTSQMLDEFVELKIEKFLKKQPRIRRSWTSKKLIPLG